MKFKECREGQHLINEVRTIWILHLRKWKLYGYVGNSFATIITIRFKKINNVLAKNACSADIFQIPFIFRLKNQTNLKFHILKTHRQFSPKFSPFFYWTYQKHQIKFNFPIWKSQNSLDTFFSPNRPRFQIKIKPNRKNVFDLPLKIHHSHQDRPKSFS